MGGRVDDDVIDVDQDNTNAVHHFLRQALEQVMSAQKMDDLLVAGDVQDKNAGSPYRRVGLVSHSQQSKLLESSKAMRKINHAPFRVKLIKKMSS
jgi:hypothetical protein